MKILLTLLFILTANISSWVMAADVSADALRVPMAIIRGEVQSSEDGSPVQFASVFVDGRSQYSASTDKNGRYRLRLPAGEQTIVVSFLGFENQAKVINIAQRSETMVDFSLTPSLANIDTVEVMAESGSVRVNKSAYNVQAIEIADLQNTTASLTDVLSKVNGVRIRESGGVGSDTKISLNGFSGSHVKIFIDGILQDGNKSFSLSNIPANFAERIEVYSGVAPIEFGSDALGGVINIVTKKQTQAGWDLDASYSYGSFNTHRSNVTFSHQLDNGFQYKVNAYQNYSDNNYEIDNTVIMFTGTNTSYTSTDVYTVERFNDTYHNEAIILEAGLRGKTWADVITLNMNLSQFYKEVQTGTRQSVVFGGRHQEGYALIPTLQYSKRDLLTEGLSVKANASYNYGVTMVVDTTVFNYNWLGDTQYTGSRSYTHNQTRSNSLNANANATYAMSEAHTFALNYTINATTRLTRSSEGSGTAFNDWAEPQYTTKAVTALSYMYRLDELFNLQAFSKYYTQSNDGMTVDESGVGTQRNEKNGYLGYGAATTGFFLNGFQAKLSYEKAYRLPTTTELLGDNDLELGNVALNPESSDNYNINLSYKRNFGHHGVELGGGLVYSDTKDFIRRVVSADGETASSVNHGKVETKGWNASMSYNNGRLFSFGGSINALNARDNEEYDVTTGYKSLTYGQRMPNEPYLYASGDGRINFYKVFTKKDHLYVVYDLFYQHQFPLYWEDFGDSDTKRYVPTQYSHNITLHYTLNEGKYNFSLECKNITDAKIYDNFSLQKAGRAFYAKVRVNFGNVGKR